MTEIQELSVRKMGSVRVEIKKNKISPRNVENDVLNRRSARNKFITFFMVKAKCYYPLQVFWE